jgi:succinate dehydrogenase/fumarate reductase flavoprotein subunit
MSWDHEVDVVVLGSGGAGLTAALTAATAGALSGSRPITVLPKGN